MATITIPTAATVGAFSADVADDAAEQGNYGPRAATALRVLATETAVLAAETTALAAEVAEGGGEGGVTTGSASSTTATNTAITLTETLHIEGYSESGTNILTMSTGTTAASFTGIGAGLRTFQFVFPAGAWAGNITVTGVGRGGLSVTETFTNPGAGGGTVKGAIPFASVNTNGIVNSAPSGAGTIGIQLTTRMPVMRAPVAAFLKVVSFEESLTIADSDLTNGWCDVGTLGLVNVYDVLHTASLNLVQASHTHTITLA